jgi:hypothetical protein
MLIIYGYIDLPLIGAFKEPILMSQKRGSRIWRRGTRFWRRGTRIWRRSIRDGLRT